MWVNLEEFRNDCFGPLKWHWRQKNHQITGCCMRSWWVWKDLKQQEVNYSNLKLRDVWLPQNVICIWAFRLKQHPKTPFQLLKVDKLVEKPQKQRMLKHQPSFSAFQESTTTKESFKVENKIFFELVKALIKKCMQPKKGKLRWKIR